MRGAPLGHARLRVLGAVLWGAALLLASEVSAVGRFVRHEVKVANMTREYFVYRPSSLPAGPRPAVLAFHGFASDPAGLRWLIKPDAAADDHGFLLIYPSAVDGSFNAGRGVGSRNRKSDDLSFVLRLLEVIPRRHEVDPSRIFALGFSNGAQLAALLACRHAEKIAAIAMVAHTLNVEPCSIETPLPALVIHGAKDPMVPFEGGGRHSVASYHQTVEFFRHLNDTGETSRKIVDRATVRCRSYEEGKAQVVGCVAFDGGHSWPGGVEFMTEMLGRVNRELEATTLVMRFFARQPARAGMLEEGEEVEAEGRPLLRRAIVPLSDENDGVGGQGEG